MGEMWNRFAVFSFCDDFLQGPRYTLRGRKLNLPSRTWSQHCMKFLMFPKHAPFFVRLNLVKAPTKALTDKAMHDTLSRMPHLSHVTLPWHGWSRRQLQQ